MIIIGTGAALAACGGSDTSPTPVASSEASVPVLSVPIVDLTPLYDFKPFGFGGTNPTYNFYTTGDTTSVRAAGPGTVVNILANPAPDSDSEVHIRPPGAQDYLVIYDHVVSLQVGVGQSVTAGQVVGRIGPWVQGRGHTELQVNRGSGLSTLALCPREFGTAEFNAAHDAALARFPSGGASVCLTSSVQP
jgi:Peptidase family M23